MRPKPKPFTDQELEDIRLQLPKYENHYGDYVSYSCLDKNSEILWTNEADACYMRLLTKFQYGEHGAILLPHKGEWDLAPEISKKFFDMLLSVNLFDRKYTEVTFDDTNRPTIILRPGIDYTYVFIAGCFYRLAESYPSLAHHMLALYTAAKKRKIKFLQCFLYAMDQGIGNWNHFFFPEVARDQYRKAPAFAQAIWRLTRMSAKERAALLKNRTKGGVSEVITRLHDELFQEECKVVYLLRIKDILDPRISPIFVNSKLTLENFEKILKESGVETKTYALNHSPYGYLRDYY